MRLSKQLFWDHLLVPERWSDHQTSSLLGNGTFCYFRDPSVPFYMPLGKLVLDGIRNTINQRARQYALDEISLPTIVQDGLLTQGQKIEEAFMDKIMLLGSDMKGYHLLFTPEPIIHDLSRVCLLSYKQLPIRFCYLVDVFRNVSDARGILKTRQFLTFVGTTVEPGEASVAESLDLFEKLSLDIFGDLGITVQVCRGRKDMAFEFFYQANEGEALFIPELNPDRRICALSLAMGYHYCRDTRLSGRFQNRKNKKERVSMTTYGLGVQRLFYAVFDAHRDLLGFKLPKSVRPAEVVLLPQAIADTECAARCYRELQDLGQRVILDDRHQYSFGKRAAFADYIGAAWKLKVDGDKLTLIDRERSTSITGTQPELVEFLKNPPGK